MFGEQISRSPRIASPWLGRLSTSASTSASTTAPTTPPSSDTLMDESDNDKHLHAADHQLPDLHLLNMSCDDALSDISDEADGFFSLDMDVSIDQQLQDHVSIPSTHQPRSAIPSPSERFHPSPQRNSRDSTSSPRLNPALRRASETVPYSSSPLQNVGLDPIMASRSRKSPVLDGLSNIDGNTIANTTNGDTHNGASPPSAFGPIAPEVDQKGNLEYKLKILPPSRERFDRLVTQLKWRLLEGAGLAVYEIGVLDDGTLIGLDPDSMKDSLKLLSLMAVEVGSNCHVQRVLALEKVAARETNGRPATQQPQSASRLAITASDLSLRALAPTEAVDTLNPYILTADIDPETKAHLLETGSAGLYRFDIAEQQTSIPPPLVSIDTDTPDAASIAVAAVDPTESAPLSQDEIEMKMSAQSKPRLLKSTLNGLPDSYSNSTLLRPKKDTLNGMDPSAIVYLPSKEEKRIARAAAAEAEAELEASLLTAASQTAAVTALSHTEAQERGMMAKMTRVADSVQPKTARARARARKSAGRRDDTDSTRPLPTPSPAVKAAGGPNTLFSAAEAYTGYENVISAFGVLSERAARTLYPQQTDEAEVGGRAAMKARLIVEAVVRRDAHSEDNYVDFQRATSRLGLDAGT
ncbi:uncharacterized protein UBRO_07809 [Ustilago bromivora]|uniref:Uncharacterized protein n=1 Tax=Ustilago bromivora TaxID=307758 RepID=A0A1K0GCV9_9BASI|nr:uncharacterized protein UBRO_07809 [Ustilago bromivora]SYW82651.1 uncharacterized protein UBRO2_04773 [Ustilago bromivora]